MQTRVEGACSLTEVMKTESWKDLAVLGPLRHWMGRRLGLAQLGILNRDEAHMRRASTDRSARGEMGLWLSDEGARMRIIWGQGQLFLEGGHVAMI